MTSLSKEAERLKLAEKEHFERIDGETIKLPDGTLVYSLEKAKRLIKESSKR